MNFDRARFMMEQRLAFSLRKPSSFMVITGITDGDGPPPLNLGRLYTRHMLGVIEAERYKRRRRRSSSRRTTSPAARAVIG